MNSIKNWLYITPLKDEVNDDEVDCVKKPKRASFSRVSSSSASGDKAPGRRSSLTFPHFSCDLDNFTKTCMKTCPDLDPSISLTFNTSDVFRSICKPFMYMTSNKRKNQNSESEKLEITAEDFKDIVEKLRDLGVVTQAGAKEFIMQHQIKKMDKSNQEEKKSDNDYFPESFLAQAARSASSLPPLIRIDEWNDNSKKWHKHGVFPVDDESMAIMNGRCETQLSEISAVLNNSTLSLYSDLDSNEEFFEEMTPETNSYLERSNSRNFLLTVRQESDKKIQSKQLVVSIENTVEADSSGEADSQAAVDGVEYKDNNVSLRNIFSMKLPSRRSLTQCRTISVRSIEFCK